MNVRKSVMKDETEILAGLRKRSGKYSKSNEKYLELVRKDSAMIETFRKMLIEDELSLNYLSGGIVSPLFLEKVLRNYENAGVWCDIKHSEKIETCSELSKKSLINFK